MHSPLDYGAIWIGLITAILAKYPRLMSCLIRVVNRDGGMADVEAPLVGTLAFGIVDRGTNIIEVRPTSFCPLSCIFCSVNAGPSSKTRWAEYSILDVNSFVAAIEEVVRFKGTDDVEVHIDGMGEPGAYPHLAKLVKEVKSIRGVSIVSMQTRLVTMDEMRLKELANAGLDRINLSVDALDPNLAKTLAGCEWYDVNRILKLALKALELGINVILVPVWVPGYNDSEIPKLAEWAYKNGLGMGKLPPILVQKFIPHKRGRKPKNARVMDWGEFWRRIRELERRLGIRLTATNEEFKIHKAPQLPRTVKAGEEVKVEVVARGIFKGEYLGVIKPIKGSAITDRVVTLIGDPKLERILIGSTVKARIIEDDDNILIARLPSL